MTRWAVLAVAAVMFPLAGCASAIDGQPVAAAGADTTTTTSETEDETTSDTEEETTDDPGPSGGEGDLLDPTITTPKAAPADAEGFCALVTPEEIGGLFGLTAEQPSSSFLCTVPFSEGGNVLISELGAFSGTPLEIGGNSAVMVENQSGPNSCQVTVALNDDFDVLDIDARGGVPAVEGRPVCDAVRETAALVFDKLPDA